jgi:hypothetical protein
MADVFTSLNFNGNRLFNADLTALPSNSFPPMVINSPETIIAGPGIIVADNGDGTITISAAPPVQLKVEAYRERFTVTDPFIEAPLTVTHNLASTGVAVTVIEVNSPSRPVAAQVEIVTENMVAVSLTGEPGGVFDVLVIAGVDPGGIV